MAKKAAKTGSGPTFMVAMEQLYPAENRIMDDPGAYNMMDGGMKFFYALMKPAFMRKWMVRSSEKSLPGIWGGLLARKCFIDDVIRRNLENIEAVINLGAGSDTLAFRLDSLRSIPVWEVDQPANIYAKEKTVDEHFRGFSDNLNLVPVDFDREVVADKLTEAGYDFGLRTCFVMEGVTQYLTDEGVAHTFEMLSKAAPGSMLVFTYIPKDFIEGKALMGQDKAYEKYVIKDKMWMFGKNTGDWPEFLSRYGWRMEEDIDGIELHKRYIGPKGRKLLVQEIERSAVAVKI